MPDPIYLDYNATTPIAPEVLEEMIPCLRGQFGNPSSTHPYGTAARAAVEKARERVAALIGAHPDEILFTSGGTESNNLAIFGTCRGAPMERRHIVTSCIEHPAVEEPLRALEAEGWTITRLPVGPDGRVDAGGAVAALTAGTALVTIMHANNETGALQPIGAIARAARGRGIPFHTDAAQSAGKVPLEVRELEVDLLTIAGHKLYAPKGVGALYVRRGTTVARQMLGAAHESGRRAGTENVASIVALGAAAELAAREGERRVAHLRGLRDRLHQGLLAALPDLALNGPVDERLPNTLNVSIPGADAGRMIAGLQGVATSAGAACHATGTEPSAVLLAMGVPRELALCALRLSVGRPTTEAEVDRAAEEIAALATRLRGGASSAELRAADGEPVRLTRYTRGLGCACKLRPRALEDLLRSIPMLQDERVLVGPGTLDDAAVYRLDGDRVLVATADFFPPVVDDPREFGEVAAANALSDLYAMGATPLFALGLVGFPSDRLPLSVLRAIQEGAAAKAAEAGVAIVGGHTIDAPEPLYGLAAVGEAREGSVWTNAGGRAGDRLVLTKPIGTGVIATAAKRGMADEAHLREAIATMAALNRDAAEAGREIGVTACTDVTGFGLLGHLHELAAASGVAARVEAGRVPLLPGAAELAAAGAVPGGTEANREHLAESVTWAASVGPAERTLLCDAQTSGGLLFAVRPERLEALLGALARRSVAGCAIGELLQGAAGTIEVRQ